MRVRAIDPFQCFVGVGPTGAASLPVSYRCVTCGHSIMFDAVELQERHIRYLELKSPFTVLTPEESSVFEPEIRRHVRGLFDRFVTDFKCPSCNRATAILWSWSEAADQSRQYSPIAVLLAEDGRTRGDA